MPAKLLQYAAQNLEGAMEGSAYAPPSPGELDRIRALADACEHIGAAVQHASQTAGIRWRGLASFGPDTWPYELRPGGNRPERERLWEEFDAAVEALELATTGHEMGAIAEGLREVADALTATADELDLYG